MTTCDKPPSNLRAWKASMGHATAHHGTTPTDTQDATGTHGASALDELRDAFDRAPTSPQPAQPTAPTRRETATPTPPHRSTHPPEGTAETTHNPPTVTLANRYRLLHQLGTRNNSAVFAAYDERLRRHIVIKTLPAERAHHQPAHDAFHEEAQLYAHLSGDGVVRIHDLCTPDNSPPWMVLEHVDGVTLTQTLRAVRRNATTAVPLPLPAALGIIDELLRIVGGVHAAGYVHRDLSPSNIMIARDGTVRLVDFELAVAPNPDLGTVRGTVHFMSPEHLGGVLPDARSDVYSLTCVAYTLLTGRPPFLGNDATTVAGMHRDADAPLVRHLVDGTPSWIDFFIYRGLAKDPRERYRDAHHMREELHMYRTAFTPDIAPMEATGELARLAALTTDLLGPDTVHRAHAPKPAPSAAAWAKEYAEAAHAGDDAEHRATPKHRDGNNPEDPTRRRLAQLTRW